MVSAKLQEDLYYRHESGKPILIGLVGTGQMGIDIIVQVSLMRGMRIGAIRTTCFETLRKSLGAAGYDTSNMLEAKSSSCVDRAIENGCIAVTDDFSVLVESGLIEVVIDATGSPELGTRLAFSSISNGKHIVLLNLEADVTIGRAIRRWAKSAGVVCTGAAGDEPAAAMELVRFAEVLGLEVIAAGKGKNNPLDVTAVPEDYLEEAERRCMNPRVLVEFVDGTKTQVEMTALANTAGLTIDVPGMHGTDLQVKSLPELLCPREDGGLLGQSGVVEYVRGGGIAPGVFVIVRPRCDRVFERMLDLKVINAGRYFALIRPFHLTSLEVPLSAARAVLQGTPDVQILGEAYVECCAVAKRKLQVGEKLTRIGMSEYRGFAVTHKEASVKSLVPIGLCEGAVVLQEINCGDFITYDNVSPDASFMVTRVRMEMDSERIQAV